jgi:hypothetical protein
MALACCILGKFLGVVCHCFPLVYDEVIIFCYVSMCLKLDTSAAEYTGRAVERNCAAVCSRFEPGNRLPQDVMGLLELIYSRTAVIPLPYTVIREMTELARSVNIQPSVRWSEPSMSCS